MRPRDPHRRLRVGLEGAGVLAATVAIGLTARSITAILGLALAIPSIVIVIELSIAVRIAQREKAERERVLPPANDR
jgi:hypothetical protein